MEIIKEYVRRDNFFIVILRSNTYAHSLEYFDMLYTEAKVDFFSKIVEIGRDNIDVVQYAGRRYARTFGIEFKTKVRPPDNYALISETEETY